MTKRITLLAITLLFLLVACKKEEFTIQGQVKVYDIMLPEDLLDSVAGLPVSIYYSNERGVNVSIAEQEHRFVSVTNSSGFYSFTVTEPENHMLGNYNAYLVKESAFDSTKVEWHYLSDSTYYKAINWPGEVFFSQGIGHSRNLWDGFKVVPAGWVVVKVENPTYSKFKIAANNHFAMLYSGPNGSLLDATFWLKPSRKHTFVVSDLEGETPVDVAEFELYVRNSFMRNSIPWQESLKPDTVVLDMSSMSLRVIKANLEGF